MTGRKVRIGTRGSQLALWQSNWVADRLREAHPGLEVELVTISTVGDRDSRSALNQLGGYGAFTKEVQDAIVDGRTDLAVHSLKDLPTAPTEGLRVGAYPARFDPRDAWFGREGQRFATLPPGAVVATGSLRRQAQVLHHFPDATVEQIRGNVDTRLRKFSEGAMTGMFLAMAGLVRLGLTEHVTEALEPELFLPAPGQGCLAVEGRDDEETRDLLAFLDHADTRAAVVAERSLLATLEAGCQVPVGAMATLDGDRLRLDGLVASPDGSKLYRARRTGPRGEAARLGRGLGEELLGMGGDAILEELRQSPEFRR